MNHYVYKITDPVTTEFYIGVRSCSCSIPKDDYMGSMCTWEPKDPNRLKKEVLGIFDTRDEANQYERQEIEKNFENVANRNYIVPAHGMGNYRRKSIHGEDVELERLNVWISPVLKKDVYREAQTLGMNISDYVRYILRKETEK